MHGRVESLVTFNPLSANLTNAVVEVALKCGSVLPSVSVRSVRLQKGLVSFFLSFCMELESDKLRKLMEPDF